MVTIGSVFSGIGGLELGLEMAGLGPTIWQVEQDPFCRSVLAKHWPNAERSVIDVNKASAKNLERPDILAGGFPCQDVSTAGQGAGLSGGRSGLWFEFARLIGELGPSWVVIENVTSGASRWIDQVMAGLEKLDYQTLSVPLSAADVGALHLRRREFIVAYTQRNALRNLEQRQPTRPQERVRNEGQSEPRYDGGPGALADVDGDGGNTRVMRQKTQTNELQTTSGSDSRSSEPKRHGEWSPEPAMVRGVYGVPGWLDRCFAIPAVGHERGEHDVARRKALGNSVVPACAEVIGWVIRELIERINNED